MIDSDSRNYPEEQVLEEKESYTKEEIDLIPVYFCRNCLSLQIVIYEEDSLPLFCLECSSANIGRTSIEQWKVMFKERYGYDFINQKKKITN